MRLKALRMLRSRGLLLAKADGSELNMAEDWRDSELLSMLLGVMNPLCLDGLGQVSGRHGYL